ncbi:MAG: acyl-CoA dehydratase activase [Candidatus Kapabacteria bacterium]|jgi:predicted CoA-substrate-specific enzyme activase|nr:acyl-CoA dehydratase activase [Candidatus Kapabacteria bacterium]
MNKYFGFCLGASTVSYACVIMDDTGNLHVDNIGSKQHQGNPREVLYNLISELGVYGHLVTITGRKFRKIVNISNISEPEAIESAYGCLHQDDKFSAIGCLGGETFLLYTLDDDGKISNVISKNQCASGTGEFFLQQIKRMGLSIEESIQISKNAKPYRVSGRCSVFCKTDCTHALNKGTPKNEVSSGLALMIAEKIEELTIKANNGKVLFVGGLTRNSSVMDFLTKKGLNFKISDYAAAFEAVGAAFYAYNNNVPKLNHETVIFNNFSSSFTFHQPLNLFKNRVSFKQVSTNSTENKNEYILGLDVGSTTTKAVLIACDDDRIIANSYLYTNGDPVGAAGKCYADILKQTNKNINIIGLGTTGSGRHIAGLHALTQGIVNEIVAHATAAVYFDPEVDTIFEIGGQDAKYTYVVNGVPADYAMNEACSAGTGSFIEESAYEALGINVKDIEPIAMRAQNPPNFSDQCAAFISSDIKTAQQEGLLKDDIVAGLVYSICQNYVNRVMGNRQLGKKIFMQGGVCYNKAIPIAMAALTGRDIIVPPEPGLMGAFGVALVVKKKLELGLLEYGHFDLQEMINRKIIYKKPFTCLGAKEKCDRRCTINIVEIEGKKYPFGGACNKYFNTKHEQTSTKDVRDYIKIRHDLLFKEYFEQKADSNKKSIGINASFNTQTIFPLYFHFFKELGFNIILPDEVSDKGMEMEASSFCYPAQLSLGLFQNLIDKNPDYYFVPAIYEMNTNDSKEELRLDFNCSCVFVSGEPMYLKQSFKHKIDENKIIQNPVNFAGGYHTQLHVFKNIAVKLGVFDEELVELAYYKACEVQLATERIIKDLSKNILDILSQNPEEICIVLIGRPYNAFADFANKGIPRKLASLGVYVVPYDIFEYSEEKLDDSMYWESGKRILKASKIVKNHPQLFALYVSNFSCGPDSMILSTFREIMGTKPSLTLELDGHTADAGINTRIEAAIDIIRNYRKLSHGIKDPDYSDFHPAFIEYHKDMNYFVSSTGEKTPMNSPDVKILIPSMGDLNSKLFAAALRSIGFRAEALPPSNAEIIKAGRASATGKECLPLLILAGSLIDYVENTWDGNEKIAFFNVQGAGNCRLGQYPVFLRQLIKQRRLNDVALMVLMNEDGFAGFGSKFALVGIQAIMIGDVLDDIRSAILANAVNPEKGIEFFQCEFNELVSKFELAPNDIYKHLEVFADNIKKNVPTKTDINNSKYIALLGEIYVRRDGYSHKFLNKKLAKKGFIVKSAHITEWILYVDYLLKINLLEPDKSLKNKFEREIRHYFMRQAEKKIKKILENTGYYKYHLTKIKPLLNHSKHIIPLEFKGEPGLTLGTALHESLEKYCGIINLGPFGCMPTRFTEAVSIPEMKSEAKLRAKQLNNPNFKLPTAFNGHTNIPFLTIEVDGNVFPQLIEAKLETFTLQAERINQKMQAKSTAS